MKRVKRTFVIILAVVLVFAAALAVFRLTRPRVNVVLSAEETVLYENIFPSGLFSKYRVKTTVYPETDSDCYYIYSPLAALSLSADGGAGQGAVFGLSKDYDSFPLVFIPNETKRWEDAYRGTGTALLSAVIYEESEEALADEADESFLRYSYQNSISRVGAEELADEMRRSGVSNFIIYSPWNTLEFLSLDEGYVFTFPILFYNVMETPLNASYVSEDFEAMFDSLVSGEQGERDTPYKLLERKNRVKVFLDKLF